MTIDEIRARGEIDFKWRDAWVALAYKHEPGRLQTKQEAIERRAGLANIRIKKSIQLFEGKLKLKIIWEEQDIKPGRRYSKPDITETWIIGFLSHFDGESRYVSISELDGMVTAPCTKKQLAEILTKNEYIPVCLL